MLQLNLGIFSTSYADALQRGERALPLLVRALEALRLDVGTAMTSVDLSTAFAGTQPMSFRVAVLSEALPEGLTLTNAGVLSGTPTLRTDPRAITIEVANAFGSVEVAFALEVAAAVAAPTIAASDSLDGRSVVIAIDALSGEPEPQVSLSALTLDGADVREAAVGLGPWRYRAPDSAAASTLAWTVTATNAAGSAAAQGALSIPANLAAPARMSAPVLVGGAASTTVIVAVDPADGGSPITARTWQLDRFGEDFSSPVAVGEGATGVIHPLAPGVYVARARATNSVGDGPWSPASLPATVSVVFLDFTTPDGLWQDDAGTVAVASPGDPVRRIIAGALDATLVGAGSITWTAAGLVVSGDGRMDIAAPIEVHGVVAAATPSTDDMSNNHGLLGGADDYLTLGATAHRWRRADSTGSTDVPNLAEHQLASFDLRDGALSVWQNGLPVGTTAGKTPLSINRLFHRGTTVVWNGTLSYLALYANPIPDNQREAHQAIAAATFWPLRAQDFLATPRGVPLRVERLNAGAPGQPLLLSFHGLGGTTSGDAYGGHADFFTAYDVPAFHPWFRNPPWSSDTYQKGGMAYIAAALVDACRAQVGDIARPALLFGHSAGAQWLSRVMAYAPPANVQRAVIANPSTWVFPDDRASPFGFGGYAAGAERNAAIAAYLAQPITVYVGGDDDDPLDTTLDVSADAMAQGDHRLERAQNVFAAAQAAATALSVPLNWTYVEAAGVAHSGTGMLQSASRAEAFFP